MYERFTDRSRKVMQLANEEAQRFQHEYIGTEHILLGLLKEGSGVAANVLRNLGVDRDRIRIEVETILRSERAGVDKGDLPRPPWAKKAIEYAMEEARHLNHNYVGTEHLLLGLLREPEGVAARVLMNLGLKLGDVREEVLNLLGHGIARVEARAPKPAELPSEMTARVRRVLEVAQEEAERLNVGFVGTEHLLLGLVRDQACVAVQILRLAGGTQDLIRAEVERVVGADPTKGSPPLKGAVPYSEAFNRVLTLAEQEARDGEHLGTEHLLFALLSVPEGQAAPVLGRFGITIGKAREAYRRWLSRGISPSRRLFPRESDTAFEDRLADGTEATPLSHSQRAARVMVLANGEAQRFNHEYVATEHLLLALVQEGGGLAANVLMNLGIDLRKIRMEVERRMLPGPEIVAIGKLPRTARATMVIEAAEEEARLVSHPAVGTEHLLLGLLRIPEGLATLVLTQLGVTIETVRAGIRQLVPDASTTEDQLTASPSARHPSGEESPRELLGRESRKCLRRSLEAAQQMGQAAIGTEHLLLGLLQEESGIAADALRRAGMDLTAARAQVEALIPRRVDGISLEQIRTAPQVNEVLRKAQRVAGRFDRELIATEHLLFALLREEEGIHVLVFERLGIRRDTLRESLLVQLARDSL